MDRCGSLLAYWDSGWRGRKYPEQAGLVDSVNWQVLGSAEYLDSQIMWRITKADTWCQSLACISMYAHSHTHGLTHMHIYIQICKIKQPSVSVFIDIANLSLQFYEGLGKGDVVTPIWRLSSSRLEKQDPTPGFIPHHSQNTSLVFWSCWVLEKKIINPQLLTIDESSNFCDL